MWQPVASGTIRIVRPRQDSAFESADVFHKEMRPALCGRAFSKGRKGDQLRLRTRFPNRCCHKSDGIGCLRIHEHPLYHEKFELDRFSRKLHHLLAGLKSVSSTSDA
jgi:hypothetical protein